MNSKVKNILIVTHQFVPHQSPRTTRWKLIYDELVKKGFNIRVITGTRQDGTDSNIQYIGNKTASVYQNEILNIPRIAVDTHVFRVSNRIGLVKTKNPDDTQEKLESIIPKKWLKSANHLLILHGRYKCKAQNPFCSECIVLKLCNYENKNEADKKNISSKSQ